MKEEEGSFKISNPLDGLRLEPREAPPNQSGVTTEPLMGFTVILIETPKYFKYVNYLIIAFTSLYTCRVRFPTDPQLFRAIIKRQGLISAGGLAHTKHPSLLLTGFRL
jgi:hypothetical protein